MRKLLLIVLALSIAIGCSSKGKGGTTSGMMDPVVDAGARPLEEKKDLQDGDLDDGDLSEGSQIGQLNPVFFQYDSFDVTKDQLRMLESNARVVVDQGLPRIRIEGHCDERGTEEYNLALGDRRARAAKDHLVSLGVAPDRIQTISFGENRPFEKGHDESAWSLNRRAHFIAQ